MNIPDFSKPSADCFLTVDKNGKTIKEGDVLESTTIPFRGGYTPVTNQHSPVEIYNGQLVVPQGGSFLVKSFVESMCQVKEKQHVDEQGG